MNYEELKFIIDHIKSTYKCIKCNENFNEEAIDIIACTNEEALLSLYCGNEKCNMSAMVTASLTPQVEVNEHPRDHASITKNEVLDLKNFLTTFDGDFKKIFKK